MKLTLKNRQLGQGMTEYIIIVALIAIAAITVYTYFGSAMRNQTAAIAQELTGVNGQDTKNLGQAAAATAAAEANTKRNLDTYTNNVGR